MGAVRERRYVEVRYPWQAAVDKGSGVPARLYTRLIGQALRYGLPASRRFGPAWAVAARVGVPEGALAAAIRTLPGRRREELDHLVSQVTESWARLVEGTGQPSVPPELSVLALQRSAALTVFVLGAAPEPLLVLKVPEAGDVRVDREVGFLRDAEPAGVAPRALGRVGDARVQEGLPGAPLRVEPLTVAGAGRFEWTAPLSAIAAGLGRLGQVTAERAPPEEITAAIEQATAYPGLDSCTRRRLEAAWADVRGSRCSVLRHRDTSPQNCLMVDGNLSGIVDWEMAVPRGGPGFDVWNLALSYMEYGIGLTRWSQERVRETFATAWRDSPFWRRAREEARASALAGGASERHLDALEVCFFGSRIGDRLARPGWHPTGPDTAARALQVVCAD